MSVCPAKTQISLDMRPVWSASSLCAQWVAKGPRFLHADSEDSDQTWQMPRLIWVFAGRTLTLLVLSWGGSNNVVLDHLMEKVYESYFVVFPRHLVKDWNTIHQSGFLIPELCFFMRFKLYSANLIKRKAAYQKLLYRWCKVSIWFWKQAQKIMSRFAIL